MLPRLCRLLLFRGHSLGFLQLQFSDVGLAVDKVCLLWRDRLRLNNLYKGLVFGKCLSKSRRKFFAMLVFTDLLKGGLNQIMFLCYFRFADNASGAAVVELQMEYSIAK